jgi:hypothetical protein
MLVTVTNTTGTSNPPSRAINSPAVGEDGIALPGGNHPEEATHRTDPLPYPFNLIGELADTATRQLPMHPRDWRYQRSQMARGLPVSEEWGQLVQAGTVTLTVGAQAGRRDSEELYMNAV